MLTQQRLRELLDYDPDTGTFRWRNRPVGNGAFKPEYRAGAESHGYTTISVEGERFFASRLAWLYMTGKWPDNEVDHINGRPADDRWSNLREATRSQQVMNTSLRIDNKSGSRGVIWSKSKNKWRAFVNLKGRQFHCGYFDTIKEAKASRDAKATLLHGEFARFDTLPINRSTPKC